MIRNHHDDEPVANSSALAPQLEKALGIETRLTTLGHIQRGGIPSATDRILATQLGTTAARLIHEGVFGVMVAVKGKDIVPVPLHKVAWRQTHPTHAVPTATTPSPR